MINRDSDNDIRPAAVLTNSYVASSVINTNEDAQLTVYVDLTLGSLTSAEVKFEFSPEGTNWYQETFGSIAAGVDTASLAEHKMTASGAYRFSIPVSDARFRVSAKGTGTVTGSSMTIQLQEANS